MKKMLFFLAFTIAFTHGFGQNLDSLAAGKEVDSLIKVSQTFIGQRNFDKALEVNAAAEKIALEKLGRESALYGSACFNHGRILYLKGDLLEAEKWYIESKVIREQVLGKEHPDYAASLNNLGALYLYMGDYEKAEAFFLEAKDIREKSLGKDHPDYATSLNNLAFLYSNVGDYEQAESFHLESKAIREKALGKNHPDYAASLNNLGILYWNMGQYEKAEQFYLESKAIREKALGKDSPDYAGSLTNLAVLYMDMGQYEKAEPLCLESSIITEKSLGKDHPDYAKYLNNLGILYWNTGQYEKAEPLFLESKSIREKAFGKDSPDYAASLINLAILYSEMGSFEKAEQICLESLTITEKSLGKDHPDYAASLTSLAILYHKMGDYEKAGPFYLESKSIREKALGKYHREYAMSLNNLASWYSDMGQYEKAENLYLESLTIKEKTLGKEHPDYAMSLINLAILYREMGIYEKAEGFYKELVHLDQLLITKSSKHLSEQELNNYVHTFSKEEDQLLSFISIASAQAPRLIPLTYSNALFHKGFLLNAVNQVKRLALTDSASTEKYYLLKSCHRLLAGEYARPVAERDSTFIVELEEKANILEKDLTHTVAGYKEAMSQVTWKEVHQNLKSKEAAVEFIHYRYYNEKNQDTDSTLYAALLLRPGWSQPRMVTLFEQKTIQPLLNADNTNAAAAQLYAARGKKKQGRDEGIVVGIGETTNLYQLIWQPLDSLLEGAKTVYFSPSGMLHRLNLGAVPIPGSKQILADRYQLVQVGSTRQLVVGSGSGSSTRTAALFGALKFDAQTTVNKDTLATANFDITSIRRALGAGRGDTWNYLPGTEKEIRNIAKTLGKAGYAIQSSTGYNGTEAAFKSLGTNNTSSPTVLHIATHGFFFPDPKDTVGSRQSAIGSERQPVFKTSDNPLMRSGLILAGANRAWAGGKTPEGQEDGILTAYEISQMNLSNTELVVLSACETGLGDVSGNEGVYGLQRAFKIAGAKYLVMSLWQVPDKETSEFMSAFYHKWLEEKMSVPDAFRAAQSEMRERFENPYLWAGFVLVE